MQETLEELGINNLKILQKKDGFRFGSDAVFLCDFIKTRKTGKKISIADLGTGTGIIPLLLHAFLSPARIDAYEIDKPTADMASRSIALNNITNIDVHNIDIKDTALLNSKGKIDIVTANPPYFKMGSGFISKKADVCAARSEQIMTLEDCVYAANKLLKYGGYFYLVHKPERLCDIFFLMRKYKIEPKRMQFSANTHYSPPSLVFIEGKLGAKPEIKILPTLIPSERKE